MDINRTQNPKTSIKMPQMASVINQSIKHCNDFKFWLLIRNLIPYLNALSNEVSTILISLFVQKILH